jgi:hypothetical protein
MMRAAATGSLVALALAVLPCALAAQTAPPSPAPSAAPLPEIGRTRALLPACAVLRDVTVPSLVAAHEADLRFGQVQTALPRYAELKNDYASQRAPVKSDGIFLEAQIRRLDMQLASLLQANEKIRALLADPRIANATDPAIVAQRDELERVYAAQQTRATLLNAFIQRQQYVLERNMVGWEDPEAIAKMNMPRRPEDASVRRNPLRNRPPGMPVLTGFTATDKEHLDAWSGALAQFTRQTEAQAALALLPIAQSCR